MPTTLGEFHDMVEDALGRSSLNSRVPKRTAMAANWIERNYTFQYMRTWRELSIDASATYPHIISLHNIELKKVSAVRARRLDTDGNIVFDRALRKLKPDDRETRAPGTPESFWANGRSSLILNSIPNEDMTLECHFVEFTKWGSGENWTHWLLDNATQLLLCRTLMMMASGPGRDAAQYQMYKTDFDLEMQSFKVSEEEFQEEDFVQVWEPPEYAERDDSLRSA